MNKELKAPSPARSLSMEDYYGDRAQNSLVLTGLSSGGHDSDWQHHHHYGRDHANSTNTNGGFPMMRSGGGDFDSPATVAGDADDDLDKRHEYSFYDLQNDGALRGGGQIPLFSRKTVGLLLNYAGIGMMYGALPSTMLPFLKYYLNMESYQVQAASAVVNIAWSFKMFGGVLSDSFPVFGYRRKSYMVIGWSICFGALLFLSTIALPESYYVPNTRSTTRQKLNPDAPHRGWMYVLTMALATFGYFFANVASDGMVVEIAQREPMRSRGETQTMAYATRSLFMIVADMFIGMTMNSERYGGSFSWSLDYNQVMLILSFFALAPLLGSVLLLHEEKLAPNTGLTFRERCAEMWRIAQSRAVWQVLAFELVAAFCLSFSSAAGVSVETNWATVQPFQKSIASLVTGLIYTAALYVTKMYLLQVSWIQMFCVTTIWIVCVKLVYVGCTVFNVVRNQYFWLYMQAFVSPASALRFLLFSFPIVEIAEKGFEGTTYGLVVTFHNMAIPLGVSAYKSIDSYFDISDDRIHEDSSEMRWTVFYTYLLAWGMQLASMVTIFMLPRQRLEIQHLRFYGRQSKVAGYVVVVTLVLVLLYSATTNVLSLFKSTQCLRIAGGRGCPKSS